MILAFVFCALAWAVCGFYLTRLDHQKLLSRPVALLALASAAWSLALFKPRAISIEHWVLFSHALEVLRLLAWWHLIQSLSGNRLLPVGGASGLRLIRGVFFASLAVVVYAAVAPLANLPALRLSFIAGSLALASLAPLVAMEQLYRNLPPEQRWATKFIWLAVMTSTSMDLFSHGYTLLFQRIEIQIWLARGPVGLLAAILLLFGVRRLLRMPAHLALSHQMVFYTGTLMTISAFLILVAGGAWYIRHWGGQWSTVFAALFVAAALAVLASALLSGRFRSRFRVLFSQHFLPYRYDHRMEWLRLSDRLASGAEGNQIGEAVLKAFAEIVDSPAGLLLVPRQGSWHCQDHWNLRPPESSITIPEDHQQVMQTHGWIYQTTDDERSPAWLDAIPDAWLAIPLPDQHGLLGVLILATPLAPRRLNWEDFDLLKVAARQAGAVLAQEQASEALSQARQFAAMHQSTAFLVHDLKTVVAQLSLMHGNAERHRNNPEFFDDMVETVGHSVGKMERILRQLRQSDSESSGSEAVNIVPVLEEVVQRMRRHQPAPSLDCEAPQLLAMANRAELATVIEHLTRNAQEACEHDGQVELKTYHRADRIYIEVRDNGSGMSEDFVRTRLFTPFNSTKGLSGMGIGAFQSRALVEGMGGNMTVESRLNSGTCFTIQLNMATQANSD